MKSLKTIVPIVIIVLLALGVDLEKYGISLDALTEQSASETRDARGQAATAPADTPRLQRESGTTAPVQPNRQAVPHWSSTRPEINLRHVFEGEINRRDAPTGFHARPGGVDPAGARVVRIKDRPNRAGVYTADVEVRDGRQWKSKFSSFFPDSLSQQQVIDVILHAYRNSRDPQRQPWTGPSGLGFQVQGYTTSRGGINTAFPVYNRNQ
ncbi:MAG: EndoU domain-containing protein [Pseudomonadota bacterium]